MLLTDLSMRLRTLALGGCVVGALILAGCGGKAEEKPVAKPSPTKVAEVKKEAESAKTEKMEKQAEISPAVAPTPAAPAPEVKPVIKYFPTINISDQIQKLTFHNKDQIIKDFSEINNLVDLFKKKTSLFQPDNELSPTYKEDILSLWTSVIASASHQILVPEIHYISYSYSFINDQNRLLELLLFCNSEVSKEYRLQLRGYVEKAHYGILSNYEKQYGGAKRWEFPINDPKTIEWIKGNYYLLTFEHIAESVPFEFEIALFNIENKKWIGHGNRIKLGWISNVVR